MLVYICTCIYIYIYISLRFLTYIYIYILLYILAVPYLEPLAQLQALSFGVPDTVPPKPRLSAAHFFLSFSPCQHAAFSCCFYFRNMSTCFYSFSFSLSHSLLSTFNNFCNPCRTTLAFPVLVLILLPKCGMQQIEFRQ